MIKMKITLFLLFFFGIYLNANCINYDLIGYWHNWNTTSAPYVHLDSVDSRYDYVEVAFAVPTSTTDMTMLFTPEVVSQSTLITKIQTLQSRGKKVLISIGGANASIDLTTNGNKTAFISSMSGIISTYGFDGIDIDIENGNSILINNGGTISNPGNQAMINLIDAIKQIMADYRTANNRKLILTLAPETAYVQGGQSAFGNIWGGYLPIIHALRDSIDVLQVQLYNSGTMYGLDGSIYSQGTADFIVAMTEASIRGFNTSGGTFNGLPENKIAIGLPACISAAGGGFADSSVVRSAVNYLLGKGPRPGSYILLQTSGYPNLRGLMTWSINWDAVNTCGGRYEFAESYQRIFEPISQISCSPSFSRICKSRSGSVPFTVSGIFNSGNVFTAQLSDATGSFANPVNIGTLSGTASGTILATIPSNASTGTAYRIRVVSSNPAVTGSDNGSNLAINPLPTPSISPTSEVCVWNSEVYSTASVPGHKYKWSLKRGLIIGSDSSSSVAITWTSAGIDSIKLVETNPVTFCSDSVTQILTIKALPVMAINGISETCENTVLEYYSANNQDYTYNWSVSNAFLGGSNAPNFMNISFADAGTATIKLVVTDNVTGCKDSVTKSVVINSLPKPEIRGMTTVCQQNQYIYTAKTEAGKEYKWKAENGSIIGSNENDSVLIIWLNRGIGKLKLIMSDSLTFCTDSLSYEVNIKSLPKANISGPDQVKKGTKATYSTLAQYVLIEWSVIGGTIQGPSSNNDVNVLWGNAGKGIVKIVISDLSTDCKDSTILIVNINSSDLSISGFKSVCEHHSSVYTPALLEGRTNFWIVNKGGAIQGRNDSSSVIVNWGKAGTGELTLIQTIQSASIKDTAKLSVTLNSLPEIDISGATSVKVSKIEKYSTSGDTNILNTWSAFYGAVQGNNSLSVVYILWYEVGNGKVKLTKVNTETGCSDSSEIDVIVAPDINFVSQTTNLEQISISPNPAENSVRIAFWIKMSSSVKFTLFDVSGRSLIKEERQIEDVGAYSMDVDISDIQTGIYYAEIRLNGQTAIQKVVVVK